MAYYIEIDTEIDHRGDTGGGVGLCVYNVPAQLDELIRCEICRQEGGGELTTEMWPEI